MDFQNIPLLKRFWLVRRHIALVSIALFYTSGSAPTYAAERSEKDTIEPTVVKSRPVEPTVVSYPEYRDPLIKVNRVIFSFNDITYRYALIPLSKGYLRVVPEPVQQSVGNFFYNLKTPIYAVNHLLQGEFKSAGRDVLRFGINTTIGVLGFFDPAKRWYSFEREETNFENTLSDYNVGYGFYLVLPLLGPSDARNGASAVMDYFLDPVPHLTDNPESTIIQTFDGFQGFAPSAEQYLILRDKSEDPYLFFRNLHLQGVQRDAEY